MLRSVVKMASPKILYHLPERSGCNPAALLEQVGPRLMPTEPTANTLRLVRESDVKNSRACIRLIHTERRR
jgi:hypothetical protein